ncbi:hypothetical protein BDV12DRAFT_196300 [Aspergillus spectabilis]
MFKTRSSKKNSTTSDADDPLNKPDSATRKIIARERSRSPDKFAVADAAFRPNATPAEKQRYIDDRKKYYTFRGRAKSPVGSNPVLQGKIQKKTPQAGPKYSSSATPQYPVAQSYPQQTTSQAKWKGKEKAPVKPPVANTAYMPTSAQSQSAWDFSSWNQNLPNYPNQQPAQQSSAQTTAYQAGAILPSKSTPTSTASKTRQVYPEPLTAEPALSDRRHRPSSPKPGDSKYNLRDRKKDPSGQDGKVKKR